MEVIGIIQARMSSERTPGKMLREVAGQPVLKYVLERVARCRLLKTVIVATSEDVTDDALAEFCRDQQVECHRGPLLDVAARFKQVLDLHPSPAFARICGDRALYDQGLLEKGIELFHRQRCDLVTNIHPRSYPVGQTVEIVSTPTFIETVDKMSDPRDKEHVTLYMYQHADGYRIVNFPAPFDRSDLHMAIDTESDLELFMKTVARMAKPHWEYDFEEVIELQRQVTGVKDSL